MIESAEGIGSRKWSLLRVGVALIQLMEGKKCVAILDDEGEKTVHLLVTVPQLWDAANQLLKLRGTDAPYEKWDAAFDYLGNMVAKSVGKDDWSKVAQ